MAQMMPDGLEGTSALFSAFTRLSLPPSVELQPGRDRQSFARTIVRAGRNVWAAAVYALTSLTPLVSAVARSWKQ